MSGAMLAGSALRRSLLRRPAIQTLRHRPQIQMPLSSTITTLRSRTQTQIRIQTQRQARWQSSANGPPSSSGVSSNASKAVVEESIPVPNTVAPIPLWERLGPLTSALQAYARSQQRRPYTTQFFTALLIYFLGDMSAQFLAGDEEYDPSRTGRSLAIGGVSAIPSYLWLIWLSHHFNYASRVLSIGTKIVVSQVLFTPTFNTYFFGAQALLSGCSPSEILDRIVTAVPPSIVASLRLWPFVTAFSFTFVPMQHRNSFAGVIAIGWQTYLALLNRRAEKEAQAEAENKEVEATAINAVQVAAEPQV